MVFAAIVLILLLLHAHAQADEQAGATYRVGVKQPNAGQRKAAAADGAWSLLEAVQQKHKVCPAVMTVSLISEPEDGGEAANANGGLVAVGGGCEGAVLSVELWRTDMIACTVETDRHLVVQKADDTAPLVFGMAPRDFSKMDLKKWVNTVSLAASKVQALCLACCSIALCTCNPVCCDGRPDVCLE